MAAASLRVGTRTDCGLRNALNVKKMALITFPFKGRTFLFFNVLWVPFTDPPQVYVFRDSSYTELKKKKNCMKTAGKS